MIQLLHHLEILSTERKGDEDSGHLPAKGGKAEYSGNGGGFHSLTMGKKGLRFY
jgi:hypothetical protein